MKAIVVTDQSAGSAGMKLAERPEPRPSISDVVVQVYASGFVNTELAWPSTWTDRLGRDGRSFGFVCEDSGLPNADDARGLWPFVGNERSS